MYQATGFRGCITEPRQYMGFLRKTAFIVLDMYLMTQRSSAVSGLKPWRVLLILKTNKNDSAPSNCNDAVVVFRRVVGVGI